MPSSTSHRPGGTHTRGAHGAGSDGGAGGDEGGGGGGGGGGGRLVKVAFARTQAEAELIQGLLGEAGIPSVLQQALPMYAGSYIPGPSNVMVTAQIAPRAREVLKETFVQTEAEEIAELEAEHRLARGEGVVSADRLALWLAVAVAGAVALIWVLYEVT